MLIWYCRQTHRSPEDSKARKCPECNKVRILFSGRIFQFQCFSGVRFHACLFHAPANARLWSPLSPVWKDLLKTVAVERTHADAHRGKAVRVSHLWKVLLRQVKPQSSSSDSRGCKSENMILCFIHKPLRSLSTAADVEKNLHSSPIWWNTKRRDAPAQQLRFWKCVCEEEETICEEETITTRKN